RSCERTRRCPKQTSRLSLTRKLPTAASATACCRPAAPRVGGAGADERASFGAVAGVVCGAGRAAGARAATGAAASGGGGVAVDECRERGGVSGLAEAAAVQAERRGRDP